MSDELRPDLDERIRRAFEPGTVLVRRVVQGAMGGPLRVLPWRPIAFAAGASVLCVAAVLALWMSPNPVEPESAVPILTAACIDGVVVLPMPDGSVSASSGEARDDRPPKGRGIILVEGASR
jgi:hypothetical protein